MAYLDAFGLEVQTDTILPGTQTTPLGGQRQPLTLISAPADELPSLLERPHYVRNLQAYGGAPYVMLEGADGDILFAYGRAALAHLSADGTLLRCAVGAENDPAWQRVLLDTVLWTVSLLRGFELLHAATVAHERGLVALVAHTGGGKSSLAAEFLRRGASLFSDDILALADAGGTILAHAGPALMNLPHAVDPSALPVDRVLADFGDERWVALNRPLADPRPVSGVVLVNRVAGERPRCEPTPATSLTLLPHALSLPHLQDRARRRFDIFGGLVAQAPVYSLHADPALSPSDLADLIEEQLG
jgi:hypothetical protein